MIVRPTISIIVAVSENGVIGNDGGMPWHISADLKRFRELTMHHPIIMGRKTFESIGRPLPGRTNIVITRDPTYLAENCLVVHSLKKALEEGAKAESEEIFIIGGGEIYKEAISQADTLYLTLIRTTVSGNIFFPDYSEFRNVLFSEDGSEGPWSYTFFKLTR